MSDKKVYFNKPQRLTQLIGANTTNANINWIVAGQPKGRRLNVIKSFYVKFERKIPALVDDFCRYYAEHRNKTVVFYYDATALGSNYAVNEQGFRWVIAHEFERHGWQVEAVYIGNPMRHDESSTKSLCSFENIQSQRTTFSSTRASQGSNG